MVLQRLIQLVAAVTVASIGCADVPEFQAAAPDTMDSVDSADVDEDVSGDADSAEGSVDIAPDATPDTATDTTTDTAVEAPKCPGDNFNIAWVSADVDDGNFGGLEGADELCRNEAMAADLTGTEYIAWLSDADDDAIVRLGTASGWVRPDCSPVAATQSDLAAGSFWYPPKLDALGEAVHAFRGVYTGTHPDGTRVADQHCMDWSGRGTATRGLVGASRALWTSYENEIGCSAGGRLVCLQIDHQSEPPAPVMPPGARLAFLSTPQFLPSTGSESANDLCAEDADTAGLPSGNYLALLAQGGMSPGVVFLDGYVEAPLVRGDGVVVLTDTLALLDKDKGLDAAIDLDASGSPVSASDLIATGSGHPSVAALAAEENCDGWNESGGTQFQARSQLTGVNWFAESAVLTVPCDVPQRVYCLQHD